MRYIFFAIVIISYLFCQEKVFVNSIKGKFYDEEYFILDNDGNSILIKPFSEGNNLILKEMTNISFDIKNGFKAETFTDVKSLCTFSEVDTVVNDIVKLTNTYKVKLLYYENQLHFSNYIGLAYLDYTQEKATVKISKDILFDAMRIKWDVIIKLTYKGNLIINENLKMLKNCKLEIIVFDLLNNNYPDVFVRNLGYKSNAVNRENTDNPYYVVISKADK